MSQFSDELPLANEAYAEAFGERADHAFPPARPCAVLTGDLKTGRLNAAAGATMGGAAL